MRNLLVIVVAALALAWLVNPTTASADDRHVVNLQGVIAHVGDAGIVLHTRRGDVRISVVERTEITLNGRPARLSMLERGDLAKVRAVVIRRGDHRRVIAAVIQARRDR